MFLVKGSFRLGDKYQSFNIRISANNEKNAIEKTLIRIGSKHKCKRRFIKIEGVSVVKE